MDPDVYDCRTCAVVDQFETLDDDNLAAWRTYHAVCSRFALDTGTVGHHLGVALRGQPEHDADDLLRRLDIIHDVLAPVRKHDGA
jgi:hypothetical protein